MKLLTSTILSALTLFILGFLFYWGMFSMHYMSSFVHLMRPVTDQKLLANIVGFLVQGFTLSLLYMYYFKGESPFKEGLMFGIFTGLMISLPYVFFMWANYTVRYKGVIADGIGMGIRILVAGIVIGLVFGKKKSP